MADWVAGMTPAEPWQWAFVVAIFAGCYLFIGLGRGWIMRAIQLTIFLVVAGSNIPLRWTDGPLVPSLVGVAAAWLFTVPPILIWDRLSSRAAVRGPADSGLSRGEERIDDSPGRGPIEGARSRLNAPHKRLASRPLGSENTD